MGGVLRRPATVGPGNRRCCDRGALGMVTLVPFERFPWADKT